MTDSTLSTQELSLGERVRLAKRLAEELDQLLIPGRVEGFSSSDEREIQQILGLANARCITPDDWKEMFNVSDIGIIAPLPPGLTAELLQSACPFMPGKKIVDTHLLCYLPTKIGDASCNLINFHTASTSVGKRLGRDAMFFSSREEAWYVNQPFATTAPSGGSWVLLLKQDLPNTRDKRYADQEPEVRKYPSYKTARAPELIVPLIMGGLKFGECNYDEFCGFCEDQTAQDDSERVGAGRRVFAGFFSAIGLDVDAYSVAAHDEWVGRAVVRKFEKT